MFRDNGIHWVARGDSYISRYVHPAYTIQHDGRYYVFYVGVSRIYVAHKASEAMRAAEIHYATRGHRRDIKAIVWEG